MQMLMVTVNTLTSTMILASIIYRFCEVILSSKRKDQYISNKVLLHCYCTWNSPMKAVDKSPEHFARKAPLVLDPLGVTDTLRNKSLNEYG